MPLLTKPSRSLRYTTLMKILFLEDDPVIGDTVTDFLMDTVINCEVKHCFNSSDALTCAEENSYDLYIFDINVPGISGLELLKSLRSFNDSTPAIFVTAYQELDYLKKAFEIGANDFIRKPFELEELSMRIENIKRQFSIDEATVITDELSFNPLTHCVINQDKEISLSNKESDVLHYLINNKNRVVSADELLQTLWEFDEMPSDSAIRTYIKNLRQIVGKEHILNVRGEGYRFQ